MYYVVSCYMRIMIIRYTITSCKFFMYKRNKSLSTNIISALYPSMFTFLRLLEELNLNPLPTTWKKWISLT